MAFSSACRWRSPLAQMRRLLTSSSTVCTLNTAAQPTGSQDHVDVPATWHTLYSQPTHTSSWFRDPLVLGVAAQCGLVVNRQFTADATSATQSGRQDPGVVNGPGVVGPADVDSNPVAGPSSGYGGAVGPGGGAGDARGEGTVDSKERTGPTFVGGAEATAEGPVPDADGSSGSSMAGTADVSEARSTATSRTEEILMDATMEGNVMLRNKPRNVPIDSDNERQASEAGVRSEVNGRMEGGQAAPITPEGNIKSRTFPKEPLSEMPMSDDTMPPSSSFPA